MSAIEQAIEECAQNDVQHHKGQADFLTVMQPVEGPHIHQEDHGSGTAEKPVITITLESTCLMQI